MIIKNKTDEPLVSVIMNCHNSETYLREAIESVIEQSYLNWELIFWDNQSDDNSSKILKSYKDQRIKYYLSEKQLKKMNNKGMIIGSHTLSHPVMSKLTKENQKREIEESFDFLSTFLELEHKYLA